MLNAASVTLFVWLVLSAFVPLASVTFWPLVYGLYVVLAVAALSALAKSGKQQRFPLLIIVKLIFLFILMAVHSSSMRTVTNIGSIALADVIIGLFVMTQGNDFAAFRRVLVRTRKMGMIVIAVGIIAGPIFASVFGLDNPISDLLEGKRVRIFSTNFGHSVMIDFAILFLMMAVSNIAGDSKKMRWTMIVLSLVMVFLARSSIGYIGVLAVGMVAGVEFLPLPSAVRNWVHVILAVSAAFLVTTMSDDVILTLREFQTGGNAAQEYRYRDLTAGRALLNSELQTIANSYPVFGAGTEVSLLQDGLIRNGVKMAMSESGLRLAAKYGWPLFGVVILLIASPLIVLRLRDRGLRIFAMSLSLYLFDVFAFNSVFEVAHDSRYFWLLPLLILTGSHCYHVGRRPPRALVDRTMLDRNLAERRGMNGPAGQWSGPERRRGN